MLAYQVVFVLAFGVFAILDAVSFTSVPGSKSHFRVGESVSLQWTFDQSFNAILLEFSKFDPVYNAYDSLVDYIIPTKTLNVYIDQSRLDMYDQATFRINNTVANDVGIYKCKVTSQTAIIESTTQLVIQEKIKSSSSIQSKLTVVNSTMKSWLAQTQITKTKLHSICNQDTVSFNFTGTSVHHHLTKLPQLPRITSKLQSTNYASIVGASTIFSPGLSQQFVHFSTKHSEMTTEKASIIHSTSIAPDETTAFTTPGTNYTSTSLINDSYNTKSTTYKELKSTKITETSVKNLTSFNLQESTVIVQSTIIEPTLYTSQPLSHFTTFHFSSKSISKAKIMPRTHMTRSFSIYEPVFNRTNRQRKMVKRSPDNAILAMALGILFALVISCAGFCFMLRNRAQKKATFSSDGHWVREHIDDANGPTVLINLNSIKMIEQL